MTHTPAQPSELAECLAGEPPVAVKVVDLEDGTDNLLLPPSPTGKPYRQLLALLRFRERPLFWAVLPVSPDGRVFLPDVPRPIDAQEEGPTEDSSLSIVLATCANPDRVLRCLEAIDSNVPGPFEAIVVENRPSGSPIADALSQGFPADDCIRLVEEPRPGLSSARNAGLAAASGDIVAFIDDDVLIDAAWAPAIRRAFAATPEVDCVTGLILPLELETKAQLLDEQLASFGKGFSRRVYSIDAPPVDQPLFPYTAGYFGSGANIAFRTAAIRDLNGFDRALGTGTRARSGEDIDVFIRLLESGRKLAYEPAAIVWHRHPSTYGEVRSQVFGYGLGLGATLTKHLLFGAGRRTMLARSLKGLQYYLSPHSRKNSLRSPTFPRELTRLERLGVLCGPAAYLASRLAVSSSAT